MTTTLAKSLIAALVLPLVLIAQEPASNGPKLIHEVKPTYPGSACAHSMKGLVRLDVLVDQSGNVSKVHARSGKKPLKESAVTAVQKWRWAPWLVDGKASSFMAHVEIDYQGPVSEGCGAMLSARIVDWEPR